MSKQLEAQEHCKAAEKFLKTSLLRWKPDYDSAADEYSQAAQCYRIARDLNNCKQCHLKASEYYKKNHSFFHAAKSLENALIANKEAISPEELYGLATDSANLYQQHGSGDSAANVLSKAAKIIEGTAPGLAVKLFQQAADVSSEWGNTCEAPESQTLEELLQAYDEEDRDSAKRALASPFIRSMDVEYSRLAGSIPLPEGIDPAPRAAVRENAAPSYQSINAPSSVASTTAEINQGQSGDARATGSDVYEQVSFDKDAEGEDDLC